ncbi:MAG: hybrid sensor histidine kinase/response regulator [Myxococcales bacterium]|nr:hybrid sensor histidine kinase/response regulator [Myxococcales bacterium]
MPPRSRVRVRDAPVARLNHCIRDLAALNALPSMCIGRSPEETLDLAIDALPTALSCELVYLRLPGTPPIERSLFRGSKAPPKVLEAVRGTLAAAGPDCGELAAFGARLYFTHAEVPLGSEGGRLLVARDRPLDHDTDRVLVRSAANLVGTTVESANVLDAARRKDEFLAMLGHELRGPLAPILTAIELLARNPTAAREQAVLERHTRHLARLVDDLLDISRVTRGHIELRNEQLSLDAVIDRGVEIATPSISRHRHSLRVADSSGIVVRGDPVRLAQVFGNLLTNAAKFTPAGGAIDVGVERLPGRVRVSVRDNGRGITAEHMKRIFEPFVQVDRQRDALVGGLGLGLAIVKNLVASHGGTIGVDSAGLGRGATFHVELPTVAEAAIAPAPAILRERGARSGVRVLVVDDNVDVADLLAEALRDEGFETTVANEGRTAMSTWRTFAPHAAVLDVGLPDMDGYSLARALRQEHGARATLIAATGYGEQRDRALAAEAGFDCHFVKPVSVQDLVVALDERVVGRAEGTARGC